MVMSGLEEELELAKAGALPRLLYVNAPARLTRREAVAAIHSDVENI
jgi:hypothetical protein